MRRSTIALAAGVSLLALAATGGAAEAAPGYVVQGMNMRAGPGVDYPWVAALPPGTETEIFGCLPGYTWCDVAAVGARGWVAGVGLQVLYGQQPEPLIGYGAQIGLPFIGFNFDNYWGSYYRGRPWFSGVDRWHGGGGGFDRGPGGGGYDRGPDGGRGQGGGPGGNFGRPGGGNEGGRGGPGGMPQGGQRPGPEGHGGGPGGGQQHGGPGGAPGAEGHGQGGHEQGGHGPQGHGGPNDHPG